MRTIEIYVAAHKPCPLPQDPLYVPLQAGAALHAQFLPVTDDTGDHISAKNAAFCELTALYWIWKNSRAEVVGLAHYRRFLGRRGLSRRPWKRLLRRADVERLLSKAQIILPRERHYVIETNASHYAHAHREQDLAAARACVLQLHPDYIPAFDAVMRKTHGHRFNMLIMEKPLLDRYCEWLFSVLFLLETKIDLSACDAYNQRVFGFIGERLLDVWLAHGGYRAQNVPVVSTEKAHWLQKGARFLRRKFAARKTHGDGAGFGT